MMRVIRYILVALLLVFIVAVYRSGVTPGFTIEDVQAAYAAAAEAEAAAPPAEPPATEDAEQKAEPPAGLMDHLVAASEQDIARYLGIDPALYDSAAYWKSEYALVADELAVIRAKDAESAKAIEAAIEARVASQAGVFGDYAPNETRKVNAHIYKTRGLWVFYAVGDRAGEWEQVFDGLQ